MKKFILIPSIMVVFIAVCAFGYKKIYERKTLPELNFDAAYYWVTESSVSGIWKYEENPAGYKYFLYLPPKYKNDKDNENAKLPLIVTFHGSCEKGKALSYGRFFTNQSFQSQVFPDGAAVLVPQSRQDYFTDPHSMSLFIQNVIIRNKCIDKENIIGYGFSQGAKFVVELACTEPRLFKGVISGSGFYQISKKELLSVLPISFYFTTAANDAGIFEQGSPTGKLCARFCKDSRYVEFPTRRHFFAELKDKTGITIGGKEETLQDWIISVINR